MIRCEDCGDEVKNPGSGQDRHEARVCLSNMKKQIREASNALADNHAKLVLNLPPSEAYLWIYTASLSVSKIQLQRCFGYDLEEVSKSLWLSFEQPCVTKRLSRAVRHYLTLLNKEAFNKSLDRLHTVHCAIDAVNGLLGEHTYAFILCKPGIQEI